MADRSPVVLRAGEWSATLGPIESVTALGASILYRLEPENVAQRFPLLLGGLLNGRLPPEQADGALAELETAARELAAHPKEHAVRSATDLRRIDDSIQPVNPAAANLATYFIAPDGRPMLDVLAEAVRQAKRDRRPLTANAGLRRARWQRAAANVLSGLAWALVIGLLLVPNEVIDPGSHRTSRPAELLGALGLGWVVWLGVWGLIATAAPRIGDWFEDKPVAETAIAILWFVIVIKACWW